MRVAVVVGVALLFTGCGRYDDFHLPVLKPQPGRPGWRWEVRPGPVLGRGNPGTWDSVDVLNPSVVPWQGGHLNLYSGYDGKTWHTGVAASSDGLNWTKRGKVLSPDARSWEGGYIAANGTALVHGNKLLYWYQAGSPPRIGLATSSDGAEWTKLPDPVLPPGPRGSWDERGVGDPYVVKFGESFYMYYLGQDRARRQRLGVARSQDGLRWQKLRSNPVLELGGPGTFDEAGLGEPAIWQEQGSYWMLYTGRDRNEQRRIGLARSQDGVAWARVTEPGVFAGAEAWDAKVVCDPTVERTAAGVRVWFGGGDKPEPAENLNGQIGYAHLTLTLGR